jgi:hypothetical protein
MTVFNTIKKAEHFVKYKNKYDKRVRTHNWSSDYRWEYLDYLIDYDKKYVIKKSGYDNCGCGCDKYTRQYVEIVGRIK